MSSAPLDTVTKPTDLVELVRSVSGAAAPRARSEGFSFTKAGAIELLLAPVLGIYLGYAVGRLPEVFDSLNVPHLPMTLMLVFVLVIGLVIPSDAWRLVWNQSTPMRLVAILVGLAFATIPFGIWPRESLYFLRTRYVISLIVFLCCLVLLRDRRAFRAAMVVYVLCITAVAASVIVNFNPDPIVMDADGNLIANAIDRSRVAVGVSLDSNDFGAILAATFPIALWLGVGSFRRRVFYSACGLVLVAAVVPTASRGSMLAMGAAATALLGVGSRGWRRILTFVLVAGGVGVFMMLATGAQMGRFTDFSADDYNLQSTGGRLFFWKQGMVWMLKRPWGYGLNGFPTYFDMINGGGRAAHSSWVQYGMELGIAGLTTIVTLCVFMFRSLLRHRQRAIQFLGVKSEAQNEEALASHMIAMLTGLLVADSFLSNAYSPLLYMAIGLVAAVLLGSPFPKTVVVEPTVKAPAAPRQGRRVASQWNRQA